MTNPRTITVTVSDDVYREVSQAARAKNVLASRLLRMIVEEMFAPPGQGDAPRVAADPQRPLPRPAPPPDTGYVPPRVGVEITDDDIAEMARHGFSDAYITGRYRLRWRRVADITAPIRASSGGKKPC